MLANRIRPIPKEEWNAINGCSYKGYILATFHDLVNHFGYPNKDSPSGDGKVQFEWILCLDDRPFCIYPWKNFEHPWLIDRWHIGCKGFATFDFIEKALVELGFDTSGNRRLIPQGTRIPKTGIRGLSE